MSDDIPIDGLDFSPEVAAVVFATEYDRSIRSLAGMLERGFGTFQEDRDASLDYSRRILENLVTLPSNLTVETSKPYVELSDLLYLGLLAHRFLTRMEENPGVGL